MMKRNNNALCVSAGKAMKNKAQFTRYRLLNSVGTLALGVGAALLVLLAAPAALAQDTAPPASPCEGGATSCTISDKVIYLPSFFAQYNPVTALDMVSRVPGFSIDGGDSVRGFGGAAANVLIDGQRPSTKSSDITETLSRISASNVERVELIRGGTGNLDVGGRSVVVNVILKTGDDAQSSSPWSFTLLKRRPNGGFRPNAEASFSGDAGGIKYTLGASVYAASLSFNNEKEIIRYGGDDELRIGEGEYREQGGGLTLNLEKPFANGDTARLNLEGEINRANELGRETRYLAVGGPDMAFFPFPYDSEGFEVGGDYEHAFSENFDIKLIGLFKREFEHYESGFIFTPAMGGGDESLFISDQTSGEMIGRTEFGWRGWNKHSIQFGGEIAKTFIDSEAEFLVDDGMGVLVPEIIDGANTRVSELRGETFINDSWRVSEKLTVDIGMAVELSRISQSGDSENSRFFIYPKPSLALTYNLTPKSQFTISAKREVNQLSFGEFVSSVNFGDEDVDFGNPDLQPQRTWALESSYERRFGEIGVAKLTGFYKIVNDVEDLLPIGGIVEVPGNIGDGKIWGGKAELTLPLDAIMLKNARLESAVTLQDSSITDPVTGADRQFSGLINRITEIEFRQDFPKAKISWGASYFDYDREYSFGLDEMSTFTYQPDIGVYVETTLIKGLKIRLRANDIINVVGTRDRIVYDGSRALDIPLFREIRRNQNGGGIELRISGNF